MYAKIYLSGETALLLNMLGRKTHTEEVASERRFWLKPQEYQEIIETFEEKRKREEEKGNGHTILGLEKPQRAYSKNPSGAVQTTSL